VPGERQRLLVGSARLCQAPEPAAQLGAGGVGEVVAGKLVACEEVVDETKPVLRTFVHGHGDGAIELDDRRRLDDEQAIVEEHDLMPVRGRRR